MRGEKTAKYNDTTFLKQYYYEQFDLHTVCPKEHILDYANVEIICTETGESLSNILKSSSP